MPSIQIVIQAEIDGHPVPNSPFIQVFDIDEFQSINVQKGVDLPGAYGVVPGADAFTVVQALLLANPNAEVIYRFNGQSDAGLVVQAGGLVLICNTNLTAGALTNVTVNNSQTNSPATISGFVAGSNP